MLIHYREATCVFAPTGGADPVFKPYCGVLVPKPEHKWMDNLDFCFTSGDSGIIVRVSISVWEPDGFLRHQSHWASNILSHCCFIKLIYKPMIVQLEGFSI